MNPLLEYFTSRLVNNHVEFTQNVDRSCDRGMVESHRIERSHICGMACGGFVPLESCVCSEDASQSYNRRSAHRRLKRRKSESQEVLRYQFERLFLGPECVAPVSHSRRKPNTLKITACQSLNAGEDGQQMPSSVITGKCVTRSPSFAAVTAFRC